MPVFLAAVFKGSLKQTLLKDSARLPMFVLRVSVVLAVLVLAFVLVVVGAAFVKGPKDVKVNCGPTVSTPIGTKSINYAQRFGQIFDDFSKGKHGAVETYRLMRGMKDFWSILWTAFDDKAEGKDAEHSAVTGWKNQTKEAQEKALASCCVTETPPTEPPAAPPPGNEQPWDPKNASLSNNRALSGKYLAADALRRAGFPESAIPLGVAIAKAESGFNPTAANSSNHVGLWQVSGPNAAHLKLGDRNNAYANARYAHALWEENGNTWARGRTGNSTWSTYTTAKRHAAEYANLANSTQPAPIDPGPGVTVDPDNPQDPSASVPVQPQVTPSAGCPLPGTTTNSGGGNVDGSINQIATLNPAGSGNWQGAVKAGSYWYVSHATAGDRQQIIHRLNASGTEIDHMTLNGFTHLQGFAVVGNTVYAPLRNFDVVSFPYRPNGSASGGTSTGWRGHISKDPNGNRVVLRNGNKYQAYDFVTREPVGVQITTPAGMRQGHSIAGDTVYVLTGATNRPARVDAYSIITGRLIGSRDITSLGAGRAREPEGMYGNWVGVKTDVGTDRRLKIFQINAAVIAPAVGSDGNLKPAPDGPRDSSGLTPRGEYAKAVTVQRWGCKTHPAPCISTIGGYANRNIAGSNIKSDHATGNAIDIMVAARTNKALGDQIAAYFQANEKVMNVKYVIWNRQIWSPQRSSEGWRHYNTPSGGSDHTDHVHVSVKSGTGA